MKTKFKTKKWLSALFAIPAASIFPLSSCGIAGKWDWETSTKNNTQINYCLLIGQNDHTDSQKRTEGCRRALDTFDEASWERASKNANVAKPKQGKKTFTTEKGNTREFVINEIEQMEQKSIGGASWDPITANATASTWIAKHGNDITFFVSNNDSMAEGAIWASNWITGLPIFGYDANSTTLQWVADGGITGTVDQSPSVQAAAAMMILRNMAEEKKKLWDSKYTPSTGENVFGSEDYSPTLKGFGTESSTEEECPYGYVNKDYLTQCGIDRKNRMVLSKSTALVKPETVIQLNQDIHDIHEFLKDDGSAKQPSDMFDQFNGIKKGKTSSDKFEICHTYSNRSEAFLIATMKPYYNEYASRLNIKPDIIEGDGTDETLVLNQISARQTNYDGFLICLAKTTSALQYVLDLSARTFKYENSKIGADKTAYLKKTFPEKYKSDYVWQWSDDPNWHGWDNFEERLDTPLIFWIRQPSKGNGELDTDILFNKYFKYTYYIGSDTEDAGTVQGSMITEAIRKWLSLSLDK